MKMSKAWRAMWLTLVVTIAAGAAEERMELGGELNGRWLTPDAGWDGRAVLILHGFASDSEGPADLQRKLAEALAARGVASLRVNFRGEGDSARTEILSTLGSRVADTEAARVWVASRPGVAERRVGVLGFSLGGGTAIVTAGRHPEWFRSVALWSSVSGDLRPQWVNGAWSKVLAQAEREGVGSMEIAGWKTVTLRREFFESFGGVDFDRELLKYPGPLLGVRGAADYLPAAEAKWLATVNGRPAEAVMIAGGDHVFNVFEPGAPQAAQAIAVTVAWFERTL